MEKNAGKSSMTSSEKRHKWKGDHGAHGKVVHGENKEVKHAGGAKKAAPPKVKELPIANVYDQSELDLVHRFPIPQKFQPGQEVRFKFSKTKVVNWLSAVLEKNVTDVHTAYEEDGEWKLARLKKKNNTKSPFEDNVCVIVCTDGESLDSEVQGHLPLGGDGERVWDWHEEVAGAIDRTLDIASPEHAEVIEKQVAEIVAALPEASEEEHETSFGRRMSNRVKELPVVQETVAAKKEAPKKKIAAPAKPEREKKPAEVAAKKDTKQVAAKKASKEAKEEPVVAKKEIEVIQESPAPEPEPDAAEEAQDAAAPEPDVFLRTMSIRLNALSTLMPDQGKMGRAVSIKNYMSFSDGGDLSPKSANGRASVGGKLSPQEAQELGRTLSMLASMVHLEEDEDEHHEEDHEDSADEANKPVPKHAAARVKATHVPSERDGAGGSVFATCCRARSEPDDADGVALSDQRDV